MSDASALTRTEERAALAAVGADRRLKALAGARNAPVLLRPLAGERRQPDETRHALVGFYDYDKDRAVVAVVDLASKRVTSVADSPAHFQLSAKEAREAEQLAGRDPLVKARLSGRKLHPLTRLYFPPWAGRHDPPHRYAIVFGRPSNDERFYVVVDLSARSVAELLESRQLSGQ